MSHNLTYDINNVVDLILRFKEHQCLENSVVLVEFNKVFVEPLRMLDFSIINDEKPVQILNAASMIARFGYLASH